MVTFNHHRRLVRLQTLLIAAMTLAAAAPSFSQGATSLTLDPHGVTKNRIGYAPLRLDLSSQKPAGVTKLPGGVTAPLYATFSLGPAPKKTSVTVLLDEPAGGPPRLFVDSNADGDLTDDPEIPWTATPYQSKQGAPLTRYMGNATVLIPSVAGSVSTPVTMNFYRFDRNDPDRPALKTALIYYPDYILSGKAALGGQTYPIVLDDINATGDFGKRDSMELLIDVNGDGRFRGASETYDASQPFNIGGVTYEVGSVSSDGAQITIVKSQKSVAEIPPAPDLSLGKKAPAFVAAATDSRQIHFPDAYKGRLVLLDFWATWCGPCKAELPGLVQTYSALRKKGFDVLGVSLDEKDQGAKVTEFAKAHGMDWPEVYDGGGWKARIPVLYGVNSIPAPILVDGDTGLIVASGDSLRGDQLEPTLTQALARKAATASAPLQKASIRQ